MYEPQATFGIPEDQPHLHIHFDVARAGETWRPLFGTKKNDNTFEKLVVDSSA
jgi:hypothetical protein